MVWWPGVEGMPTWYASLEGPAQVNLISQGAILDNLAPILVEPSFVDEVIFQLGLKPTFDCFSNSHFHGFSQCAKTREDVLEVFFFGA